MMIEEERSMSEQDSLKLISSMINKAQNRFSETGILYLWWSWLILLCCIVHFVALRFFNTDFYYVWFSTWLMVILQVFIIRKKKKTVKVKTYTEEINAYVWLAFFICMMLLFFISTQFHHFEMVYPLLLVLYGLPTFLSGIMLRFTPLIIGGIICWVLSLISPYIAPDNQLLLVGASVIAAWIVPGYLLKRKFKMQN